MKIPKLKIKINKNNKNLKNKRNKTKKSGNKKCKNKTVNRFKNKARLKNNLLKRKRSEAQNMSLSQTSANKNSKF